MSEYIGEMITKIDFDKIINIIESSMDDYLYVMDLQADTYRISPSALERFAIPCDFFGNAHNRCMSFIYKEDRSMITDQLRHIGEGKIKNHDMNYRWLDKKGKPVWVNGRGGVVDDKEGKPRYLIGCVNEIGNRQRADNNSGLLGEMDMRCYLESCMADNPKGFLIHIGIDNLAEINGTWGYDYGDYVLRKVARCIDKCLFDDQRLYHLVSDEYMIVDLKSHTRDEVLQLRENILEQIDEFIVSVKYKVVFSVSSNPL
ncbi:MAG: diguanylate cyclase [Clostridiales bacterium]|nr:diguanylate cyclase [Clostridiales bacterium]